MIKQRLNHIFRIFFIILSFVVIASCGHSDKSPIDEFEDEIMTPPTEIYIEMDGGEAEGDGFFSEDGGEDETWMGVDESDGFGSESQAQYGPLSHTWDLLTSLNTEKTGYGMYTYVLFGRRLEQRGLIDSTTLERYNNILSAIHVATTPKNVSESMPKETNIFYIPAKKHGEVKAVSLSGYNSTLSMKFISNLAKLIRNNRALVLRFTSRPGPFLISTFDPAGKITSQDAPFLYADLSETNPDAMKEVIKAYKLRISGEQINEVTKFSFFRLKLLNFILNADDNLTIVKAALADWSP